MKQPIESPTVERGYEHSDVAIRPLAIFLAGLAGTLIVVGAICVWLFNIYLAESERADLSPAPLAEEDPRTPGPLLQISSRQEIEELRRREAQILNEPAWIDRERGVARIPIEDAIKIVAEKGLPKWPPVAAPITPETSAGEDVQP